MWRGKSGHAHSFLWRMVAGNTRHLVKALCVNKKFIFYFTERGASRDVLSESKGIPSRNSLTGNSESETAKSLPACKTVLRWFKNPERIFKPAKRVARDV